MFDISIIHDNLPAYWDGTLLTLQLVMASLTIGLTVAIPLAIAQQYGPRFLAWPIFIYSYFFRGTPLLVQIFLIYYGIGQFEWIKDTMLWTLFEDAHRCALTAFALNTAAYTCEILRGSFDRMPQGELEAAKAAGMTPLTIMRRIILPSSMRRALPAYANEAIFMLHGTSLASTITLVEITGVARNINSSYYSPYEAFIFAGLLYLIIASTFSGLFKLLEFRWSKHLRISPIP